MCVLYGHAFVTFSIGLLHPLALQYGRTPLHVAAKYCTSPEPTNVLLEKYKCDPNAKNNIDRATPLHAAAGTSLTLIVS